IVVVVVIIIISSSSSSLPDGASQCRRDWQQYGTACYYLNSDTLTWPDAQAWCVTQGGNLASIADSGVNSHVASVISGYSKAHIGFTDLDADGTWTWYDGSTDTYTNWNGGEPNGNYQTNCGGIYSSGTWDDYPCTSQLVSVCKALIQYTATRTGCACPFDSTRTDCACCFTGGTHCGSVYPNECYYSSYSECGSDENEIIDDWQLVFKTFRGSSLNAYNLYTGSDTYNDGSTTANILTDTSESYKSSAANSYDTSNIEEVKFAFYSSGVEMMSLTFTTSGTSRTSWYATAYLTYAPYTDIWSESKNYESMEGASGGNRRFYMNRSYGGCSVDNGWVVVVDYGSNYGCSWDGYYSTPYFIYSSSTAYTVWQSGSRGFPDVFAIFYKYVDDGTDDTTICDSGWTRNGNACYQLVETAVDYTTALANCRSLNDYGDLVSVMDQDENDFILTLSRHTFETNAYWIGFNDLTEEGTWEWTDGTPEAYTNWNSGEPSGGTEHCGVLRWSEDGSWNDASCTSTYGYICKYPLNTVSCAEWKRKGYTSSGYFTIDPDGRNNGVDPFRVYCDMSSDGNTGITTFTHNEAYRSRISGHESALSYSRAIRYEKLSTDQVTTVADISNECYQHIKWECHGSYVSGYTAWYDRDGNYKNYWGGAGVDSGQCGCGTAGTCTNSQACNCNNNDATWRTDEGYLTDKTTLPVTEIRFGDTGDGSEEGYITLEPFYCKGDESFLVTSRTDFMFIKDAAISGYNNEVLYSVTPNDCAAECASRTTFTCRSFDFEPSSNTCWLSEENDQTTGASTYSTYHLYIRIFDRKEDPLAETNNCNSGWAEYNSACYLPVESSLSWYDAEVYCQEQGGHLVTPADDDEYDFAKIVIRWSLPTEDVFWIGLNDIEEEGTWKDPEGNDVTYLRWHSGEPNGDDSENGVVMYTHASNEYIDTSVENTYPAVCKAAIGASAIAQPTTHPLCSSSDWAWDDHSCYLFGSDTRSWSDAQDYCRDQGADLVTVESDREFNFLVNHYRYRFSTRRHWIGLTYISSEGVYRWETEHFTLPVTSSHWLSGQPDGANSGEECVELYTSNSYNDVTCSTAMYYICEQDIYPTSYPNDFSADVKGPSAALLSWGATPQSEQNSDVNIYSILYWPMDERNTNLQVVNVSSSLSSYYLTGLTPGTTYEFAIVAVNDNGVGPESDPPVNGTTETAFLRGSQWRQSYFNTVKGYKLTNHALYEVDAYSLADCTNYCTKDDFCLSVNFHRAAQTTMKRCVLNSDTHTNNVADYVYDIDYTYANIEGM
ncbi:C-type mannose receptor 2-like, partial [Diadema antillarum]|uniref:C-type mannose receptor 2-like n=1 Tax=Diadema antillarum TaxID=105358 RepID=UPI003A8B76CC